MAIASSRRPVLNWLRGTDRQHRPDSDRRQAQYCHRQVMRKHSPGMELSGRPIRTQTCHHGGPAATVPAQAAGTDT
eukprot:10993088-Alexandrium_andersonii.AAC.1